MDREAHTQGAVLDTSSSPHALLRPVPISAVHSELRSEQLPDLLAGVIVVRGGAVLLPRPASGEDIYATVDASRPSETERISFAVVPYYAWASRGPSPMQVWTRVWPSS